MLCVSMSFSFSVMNWFMAYQAIAFLGENATTASAVIGSFYMTRTIMYQFLLYKIISVGSAIKKKVQWYLQQVIRK